MKFTCKQRFPLAGAVVRNVGDAIEVRGLLNITFQERCHVSRAKLTDEKTQFKDDVLTCTGLIGAGAGDAAFVIRRHQHNSEACALRLFSKFC